MRTLRLETPIAAPPRACFDLSLSVDAHTASMSGSGERVVGGVESGVMGPGDSVTWRARHLGVTFRMTSVITAHEPPHRFVDEQRRGPFRSWWHEHTFTATERGTLMLDVVRFAAPLGPLGLLAEHLVLDRYLTALLQDRNTWLKQSLETGPTTGPHT